MDKARLLTRQGLATLMVQDDLHVLVVDRRRCGFSKVLLEELERAVPLSKTPQTIQAIDLGRMDLADVEADTWVPGVPCFVSDGSLHLGVDAFNKTREMVRSLEGIRLQELN